MDSSVSGDSGAVREDRERRQLEWDQRQELKKAGLTVSSAPPQSKWMEIKKRKKICIQVIKGIWEKSFRNVSETEITRRS